MNRPATLDAPGQWCLQIVWPITDDTFTLTQLIAEATPQLTHFATQAHATITGPIRWCTTAAADLPGWAAYPGLLLIAEAPATPITGPHPATSSRTATIRHLAETAHTDQQIAAMLGLTRTNVAAIRHRNGISSARRPADTARQRRETLSPVGTFSAPTTGGRR